MLADLVDIPALLVLIVATWIALGALFPDRVGVAAQFLVAAVLTFLYLAPLKRSRFRTLGYRLTGVRIVDVRGCVPSLASLTLRLGFVMFGPLNPLLDLLWIPSDRHRQALRDKFAHTYVVRVRAKPAGSAPIKFCPYFAFGWSFLFQEVDSAAQASSATID